MKLKKLLIIVALSLLGFVSNAQSPQFCPCCADEFRQFDFWIGSWTVSNGGKFAGKSEIRLIQDSCVIEENWQSVEKYIGTSYNYYDAATKYWYQNWVDNQGGNLRLRGQLINGNMVLSDINPQVDTARNMILNRITWTPNDDGTVRQLWEASQDSGQTWTSLFDGLYEPM